MLYDSEEALYQAKGPVIADGWETTESVHFPFIHWNLREQPENVSPWVAGQNSIMLHLNQKPTINSTVQ